MSRFEALLGVRFPAENFEVAQAWYRGLTELLESYHGGNAEAWKSVEALLTKDAKLITYPEGLAQGQVYPEDLRTAVWFEWFDKEDEDS
jgi:hypothetical protein